MRYTPNPVAPVPMTVGTKVRFQEFPTKPFTVRAVSTNFVVTTRQADFRPKGDLRYTVIDWRNGIRGAINVIGQGWDVTTDEACQELVDDLEAGEWEISQRNWARLTILRTEEPPATAGAPTTCVIADNSGVGAPAGARP